MARGYLIGDGFRDRIERTITRVDSIADGPGRGAMQTALQEGPPGRTFRVGTFSGAWAKNATSIVTFRNVTASPNTVVAVNLFANLSDTTATATRNCAIARDGTAWYLIAAEC